MNELEIYFNNKFGANVTIFYNNGNIEKRNNITEYHQKYNNGDSTAFESDIHQTGCTILIKKIKKIEIVIATKII